MSRAAGGKIVEIDEVAARVIRSYWALLLVMTVLPLLLVGYVMSGQEPAHVAKSRIQASSRATDAAPGDAGVSIVVSQVKAFATSNTLLLRVMRAQNVDRDPAKLAKQIEVTGLGTSTMVEMSVKDADAGLARRLNDAIATAVVAEINESNQGAITRQIKELDKRIRALEKRLGPLSRQAGAIPRPDISAANERERVQAELTDLRSNRSDLRTQLTTTGTASVVQPAVLAPPSNPVVMMSAVAGLAGLIFGILVAVVTEMFRPTIPGQSRVAKRLDTPLLGWADRTDAELVDLGRRIRLASKRAGVTQVTLVGTRKEPLPPELVSKVAAAVYGDETKVVTTARPATTKPKPEKPEKPGKSGGEDADAGGSSKAMANGKVRDTGKDKGADKGDGPSSPSGTSVVRAGSSTALKPKPPTSETVSASELTQPLQIPVRATCHVHAFEDIDPGSDDKVGVVAVVGPVTLVTGLDSVRDLITASGWPLLGVAATARKMKR
ncbi:YveK family protein [Actinomadura rudentiformis]|uniref:Polysaccharide chain length determinant N-terminal domain-containing protein n=1 Tax=Actinomadura rudentiformis TaxID=359158 RepID=A0A6H9Z2W9_9ACTN|nr:hypothetical protein [Actinomadura rudentiformis]KAB2351391.1 hypothetical protein F8566_03810 [Actinomadura rudentiformis]